MKIGVIFTGGTIGSSYGEGGIAPSAGAPRALLEKYREKTGDGVEFDTLEPYTILSENLTFSHLFALANCVREALLKWDAVIVTHGTDTLQYTGAALSYLLGLTSKPVVLVSSNYPLDDARSNGLSNFIGAVEFLRATPDARGVYVSYQNDGENVKIHRASRLLSHHALDDAVFSIGNAVAELKDGKIHTVAGYMEKEDEQQPFSGEGLVVAAERVLWLHAHPAMHYPSLDGISAVLLKTYHGGTLATGGVPLKRFAERAKKASVPVFLTGVPEGGTSYETGKDFAKLGFFELPPISPVAAYIKLCLALTEGRDIYGAMLSPLGGDQ